MRKSVGVRVRRSLRRLPERLGTAVSGPVCCERVLFFPFNVFSFCFPSLSQFPSSPKSTPDASMSASYACWIPRNLAAASAAAAAAPAAAPRPLPFSPSSLLPRNLSGCHFFARPRNAARTSAAEEQASAVRPSVLKSPSWRRSWMWRSRAADAAAASLLLPLCCSRCSLARFDPAATASSISDFASEHAAAEPNRWMRVTEGLLLPVVAAAAGAAVPVAAPAAAFPFCPRFSSYSASFCASFTTITFAFDRFSIARIMLPPVPMTEAMALEGTSTTTSGF